MNKNYIAVAVVLLVGFVSWFYLQEVAQIHQAALMASTQTNMEINPGEDEEMMDGDEMEGMDEAAMDEHMQMMDDGKTIMAMAGKMSPKVLYVSPGQEIVITNHESYDLHLVSEDGTFETEIVAAGESGKFIAPDTPGSYDYYNSENLDIVGTLVVEE